MKFRILILCVIQICLIGPVFSRAGAADCPLIVQRLPHLKLYSDSCLLLVTSKVTWNDARGVCQKMGGDLVTIKDAGKQNFILQALAQDHWGEDNVWIGANDKAHEGDWRWTDGSKLTYNRFAIGQGSNHNSGFLFADGRGEDCAMLKRDDGGRWHDMPCSPPVLGIGYHYTYICEFAKIKHVTRQITTDRVTMMTKSTTSTDSKVFTNTSTTSTEVKGSSLRSEGTTTVPSSTDTVTSSIPSQFSTNSKNVTGLNYALAVTVLTRHQNDNIIMRCPFSLTFSSCYLWYGPPNLQTLYADGAFTNPRLSSIAVIEDHGTLNLKINSLTRFDVGRYRCTVTENGVNKTHDFDLHVQI